MIVYHGTHLKAAERIAKEGLIPHASPGADDAVRALYNFDRDYHNPARQKAVYLTTSERHARAFAALTAAANDAPPILVTLSCPARRMPIDEAFVPRDDDLYGQGRKHIGPIPASALSFKPWTDLTNEEVWMFGGVLSDTLKLALPKVRDLVHRFPGYGSLIPSGSVAS